MNISSPTKLYPITLKRNTEVLIISAPYYEKVNQRLFDGAEKVLKHYDVAYKQTHVPGALEIPTAIKLLSNRYSGFVALGCVIRGETTHYESVCFNSSNSIASLGLEGICIGNGILNVENYEQAIIRSELNDKNVGRNAAIAALSLIQIYQNNDI